MTVIFIIMLFFVPSYIIGQTSFAKQTSLTEKESFSNKQSVSQKKSSAEERIPFRVMSWNVENLFDTHHDTLKNDNEFLPDAIRHWNYTKYKKKLADMARVITAVGEWNPPALVGLCEVENDSVLRDLTRRSPLKELSYRYVMTSSPDLRGIDVALLYQRDLFKLLSFRSIPIPSFKHHRPTRDLLHVSGLLLTGDTLDVIVYRFRLDECSTPQMLRQNVSALDYTARHQSMLDTPKAIKAYFEELLELRGMPSDLSVPNAIDKHGILGAFLRGIRGCQLPFAQVAEEFRLIENAARTVYLPVGEGAALCEQLQSGHVTRTLLRKLGVYSVSCYKDQFDKLDAAGALELRPDGSAILTDTSCYSEKTGLAMDVETGIGLYF